MVEQKSRGLVNLHRQSQQTIARLVTSGRETQTQLERLQAVKTVYGVAAGAPATASVLSRVMAASGVRCAVCVFVACVLLCATERVVVCCCVCLLLSPAQPQEYLVIRVAWILLHTLQPRDCERLLPMMRV